MTKVKSEPKSFTFAVIKSETNSLERTVSAKTIDKIKKQYPSPNFKVFDVTGKSEIPWTKHAGIGDYTYDEESGKIVCKLTQQELNDRAKSVLKNGIRFTLLDLYTKRDAAKNLGSDWSEVKNVINQKIEQLESELLS